jgi:hypothetical protein
MNAAHRGKHSRATEVLMQQQQTAEAATQCMQADSKFDSHESQTETQQKVHNSAQVIAATTNKQTQYVHNQKHSL